METNSRVIFIDYIRVTACFMVLLVHACEMYYCSSAPDGSPGWFTWVASVEQRLWVAIYDGICRMSVPLFMIVSAYLLVPMRNGMGLLDFYRKRARRILPPFIVFLVAYCVLPYLMGATDYDTAMADFAVIPFNFPSSAGHLWFIYPLIGLYLFIPFISPWLERATAKEERVFLAIFAISTFVPYLNRVVGSVWGECLWNRFDTLWYFSGFLGYVVLAHYIRVHLDWSARRRMAVGAACTVLGVIPTILGFYLKVAPQTYIYTGDAELTWGFCTFNVLLATFGAFLMFSCIRRESVPKVIFGMSDLTYGIYLMHLLVLPSLAQWLKSYEITPAVTIPAIAIGTFLVCWCICSVFKLLPWGHYVIGCAPRRMVGNVRMTVTR